jgi:LytS/YehU family sensor histidine kinase
LRLQTELARAQLHALEMHLSPHFLFNTLNAVAALIPGDPRQADRVLMELSSLLRAGLDQCKEQTVTLKQEVAYLGTYLAIEQMRFGDRLQVDLKVPHPLLEGLVPSFLLQPLVEAAIARCVSPRAEGGRVVITVWRKDMELHVEMASDEDSDALDSAQRELISRLANRMQVLYRDEQAVQVEVLPSVGTSCHICLPWSTEQPGHLECGGTK